MKGFIRLFVLTAVILQIPFVFAAAVDVSPAKLESSSKPSFAELRAKAETGDCNAQWSLAWAYHVGRGVTKDESAARNWWQKALESSRKLAEQGDAKAQGFLGAAYLYGLGVPRDPSEALKWLRSAADKDDIRAVSLLITMYSEASWGIPEDPVEVTKLENKRTGLYRRAADQGDSGPPWLHSPGP